MNPRLSAIFSQEASMQLGKVKICVVVPAFNEEGNIKKTIEEILNLDFHPTVLVVNDGSSDKTAIEARKTLANTVSLPFNLGIGGAVQTGFRFALENDFDIAVQVDGDGQHDVLFLKDIIAPILENKANMVIGSRFVPPFVGYRSSFVRRIGINFFAHLISFLTNNKITDPTSGFRAFDRKLIRLFANYYPQDFPEPEAIVVAQRHNMKIIEVPVQMRKRASGKSSIRYLRTLYYMIKVTVAILLDKIKTKQKI
jgi:glycosyltransferase involved in cell wall biosynthesis